MVCAESRTLRAGRGERGFGREDAAIWELEGPGGGRGLSNVPDRPIRLTPIPRARPLQLPELAAPQWRLLLVTKQLPIHASSLLLARPIGRSTPDSSDAQLADDQSLGKTCIGHVYKRQHDQARHQDEMAADRRLNVT